MIQLNNVSKKFAGRNVVNQVSCQIKSGILHILGENGSGKSTLLNLMSGSLVPDEGQILYSSMDLYKENNYKIKNAIGYIPDAAPIYPFLSGNDFLRFICKVKKSEWPSKLIETLNLDKHLSTKFTSLSYGTKKKFLLIAGMMSKPNYLLMDEPMNGLDKHAADEMYRLLTEHLDSNNRICVIISHDLEWINKWRQNYNYISVTLGST